jgi:hypothetical protein
MFEEHQNKCHYCGAPFVPLSLEFFKMAARIDSPDMLPESQITMAKTGFRNASMFCCFDHFMEYRRHQDKAEFMRALYNMGSVKFH